jgi:hypothetical protein
MTAWPWLRILKITVFVAIGFAVAWWIQGVRIGHLQANVETLTTQLSACQEANTSNEKTIGELKKEIKNANGICNSRLKTKEGLIKRLQEIDNLKQGKTDETGGNANTDPLLGELNRMFAGEADRKN